jgi:hypothetical protein
LPHPAPGDSSQKREADDQTRISEYLGASHARLTKRVDRQTKHAWRENREAIGENDQEQPAQNSPTEWADKRNQRSQLLHL